MRRKAKELQQARRDAERGKKSPGFGGFGSSSSSSSTAIITDTLVEPEKPKPAPASTRYYKFLSLLCVHVALPLPSVKVGGLSLEDDGWGFDCHEK